MQTELYFRWNFAHTTFNSTTERTIKLTGKPFHRQDSNYQINQVKLLWNNEDSFKFTCNLTHYTIIQTYKSPTVAEE